LRFGDDTVFHVSDVHDVRDFVALVFQVSAQDDGGNSAAKVPEVTVVPDGGSAVIESDFALAHGAKFFDATG
jgi:hypothetical protein